MARFFIFALIFITQNDFGQSNTSFASANRLMDSALHPIRYAKTLQDFLLATFPENSNKDGRWVYYKEQADIQKIETPEISRIFPAYTFYSIKLTNFLGYHVNQGICIILFDSLHSVFVYSAPLWYSGIGESLIKKFIGHKFSSKETLLAFMTELHNIMQIGSGFKFRITSYNENLITYDLVAIRGDTYIINGVGTKSSTVYTEDAVWRKIRIDATDFTIRRYTAINPKSIDKQTIE